MSRPLVSVIMNCYNGERYLQEAIDSVCAQTYKNWEIIFWDNHSTDKSKEIFNSYKDVRLKYFFAPKHTLLYEARNYAIDQAKGELYAFLDVDDLWIPEKLYRQISDFNDKNIGISYTNYYIFNHRYSKPAFSSELPSGIFVTDELLCDYKVGMSTIMIRKDFMKNNSIKFDKRYHIIGDFDFIIRSSMITSIACNQKLLTYWRSHENNESHVKQELMIEEISTWLKSKNNLLSGVGTSCVKNILLHLEIISLINNGQRFSAWKKIFYYRPLGVKWIKLLIRVIIPSSLLKWLRSLFINNA
jgi:glycosyltransferase involved in cell wall biosynthesis